MGSKYNYIFFILFNSFKRYNWKFKGVIILNSSHNSSNDQDKEVLEKLEELENKYDKDSDKKGVIKKLIDNLKALEVSGPETDIKKIKKDLIPAIIELLSWL